MLGARLPIPIPRAIKFDITGPRDSAALSLNMPGENPAYIHVQLLCASGVVP